MIFGDALSPSINRARDCAVISVVEVVLRKRYAIGPLPKAAMSQGDGFPVRGSLSLIRADAVENCSKGQAHHDEDTEGQ